MDYRVSVARCDNYSEDEITLALKEVLSPFDFLDKIKSGTKVAIKANLVMFKHPDAAATTHPAMICALTKLLLNLGAQVIVGDSPGGMYNRAYLNKVYSATGMHAVEDCGGQLNYNFETENAEFSKAEIAKTFTYTAWLDWADIIIDYCKLKSHGMMGMSGAAKNMFGVIPGTMKPEYHYRFPNPEDFANMIVDLDEYFKPQICIADAVIGMEGNGPTAGTPRKIGAVIASENPHAMDLLCAKIIGIDTSAVPTLKAAIKRGLAPENINGLTVFGEWKRFCIQDFELVTNPHSLQFNSGSDSFFGKISSSLIKHALNSKPQVKKSECVSCRECEKICPAHAIIMYENKPQIDREKCIKCFCCQEFCPKGAMKVHRTLAARLLLKKK